MDNGEIDEDKKISTLLIIILGAEVVGDTKPNIIFIMSDDHTWQAVVHMNQDLLT